MSNLAPPQANVPVPKPLTSEAIMHLNRRRRNWRRAKILVAVGMGAMVVEAVLSRVLDSNRYVTESHVRVEPAECAPSSAALQQCMKHSKSRADECLREIRLYHQCLAKHTVVGAVRPAGAPSPTADAVMGVATVAAKPAS